MSSEYQESKNKTPTYKDLLARNVASSDNEEEEEVGSRHIDYKKKYEIEYKNHEKTKSLLRKTEKKSNY